MQSTATQESGIQEQFYDVHKASEYYRHHGLPITRWKLDELRKKGEGPASFRLGVRSKVFYRKSDLDAFLRGAQNAK